MQGLLTGFCFASFLNPHFTQPAQAVLCSLPAVWWLSLGWGPVGNCCGCAYTRPWLCCTSQSCVRQGSSLPGSWPSALCSPMLPSSTPTSGRLFSCSHFLGVRCYTPTDVSAGRPRILGETKSRTGGWEKSNVRQVMLPHDLQLDLVIGISDHLLLSVHQLFHVCWV